MTGVAFYSGSLEGTSGDESGVLLHQLADKRCANFNTCGAAGNEDSGLSKINIDIFKEFSLGQSRLLRGECAEARENKERIEELMAVPLVQGTLRYAYLTGVAGPTLGADEKSEAEGAVFAASVLPVVAACDKEAADVIFDNMQVGQNGRANFAKVKEAFESQYECMKIACADVGGLYDSTTSDYFDQAGPCGSTSSSSRASDRNNPAVIGGTVGGIAGVFLLVLFYTWCCGGKKKQLDGDAVKVQPDGIEKPLATTTSERVC